MRNNNETEELKNDSEVSTNVADVNMGVTDTTEEIASNAVDDEEHTDAIEEQSDYTDEKSDDKDEQQGYTASYISNNDEEQGYTASYISNNDEESDETDKQSDETEEQADDENLGQEIEASYISDKDERQDANQDEHLKDENTESGSEENQESANVSSEEKEDASENESPTVTRKSGSKSVMNKLKNSFSKTFVKSDGQVNLEAVLIAIMAIGYIVTLFIYGFSTANIFITGYKITFALSLISFVSKRGLAVAQLWVSALFLKIADLAVGVRPFGVVLTENISDLVLYSVGMVLVTKTLMTIWGKQGQEKEKRATGWEMVKQVYNLELRPVKSTLTAKFIWIGLLAVSLTGMTAALINDGLSVSVLTVCWTIIPLFAAMLTVLGYTEALWLRLVQALLALSVVIMQIVLGVLDGASAIESVVLILIIGYGLVEMRKWSIIEKCQKMETISESKMEVVDSGSKNEEPETEQ